MSHTVCSGTAPLGVLGPRSPGVTMLSQELQVRRRAPRPYWGPRVTCHVGDVACTGARGRAEAEASVVRVGLQVLGNADLVTERVPECHIPSVWPGGRLIDDFDTRLP